MSSQIEKLCNAADNMSQATSSLTPVMDPYGIPEAVKVLDSMSEEVPEASPLYFFALRLLLNKDKRIMFFYQLIPILELCGLRRKWRIVEIFLIF